MNRKDETPFNAGHVTAQVLREAAVHFRGSNASAAEKGRWVKRRVDRLLGRKPAPAERDWTGDQL